MSEVFVHPSFQRTAPSADDFEKQMQVVGGDGDWPTLRIGLFGARADNSGLGNQTKEFYDHIKPSKTVVIDISHINGKETFADRFVGEGVTHYKGFPGTDFIDEWLADLDVVVCIEIPYNYYLFRAAREKGIKTVLQYNFEFADYLKEPELPYPDLLLAPSLWHFGDARNLMGEYATIDFLPVPVNTNKIPFQKRTQCKTFIHIAGYQLFEDRNGSLALLQAMQLVKNPDVKVIVYAQHDVFAGVKTVIDKRIELKVGNVIDYSELYSTGDAIILPRRYGGLSLQCQEAMASGMPVLMPDISPNMLLLHPACLFPVSGSHSIQTRSLIECYEFDPMVLAAKIDEFATMPKEIVEQISIFHREVAAGISWNTVKQSYLNKFMWLCGAQTP